LSLIFQLIINSNTAENISIIYNRGNHEDITQYYKDSYGEFTEKFVHVGKILDTLNPLDPTKSIINNFIQSCPCAVILEYIVNNKVDKRIWVCHGGVPFEKVDLNNPTQATQKDIKQFISIKNKFYLQNIKTYEIINSIPFYFIGEQSITVSDDIKTQIMWNDFSNHMQSRLSAERNSDTSIIIGQTALNDFLLRNRIDFIIRGHQDSYGNTVLFRNDKTLDWSKPLQQLAGIDDDNIINRLIQTNNTQFKAIIHEPPIKFDEATNPNNIVGPIAVLSLDKFNQQNIYKKVITISTNTGSGRNLTYDSYLLLDVI
jgi:hypothetical protein